MADTGAIDSLFIDIGADDNGAIQKLNSLTDSLRSLSSTASRISGLNEAANAIRSITAAVSQDAGGLKAFANSMKSLYNISSIQIPDTISKTIMDITDAANNVKTDGMNTLASSLENISRGISGLNATGIQAFASSIQYLNKASNITISPNLAGELYNINSAASNLSPDVGNKIYELAEGLGHLSNIGNIDLKSFAKEFQQIPKMAEAIQNVDLSTFTEQIKMLADALAPLAENMKAVADGAKALGGKLPKLPKQEQPKEEGKPKTGLADFLSGIKGIDSVSAAFEKLKGIASQTNGPIGALKESINNVAPGLKELKDGINDVVKTGLDTYAKTGSVALTALAAGFEAVKVAAKVFAAEAKALLTPLISGFQKLGSVISGSLLSALRQMPKTISGISSALKSGLGNMAGLFAKEFTGPITSAIKQITAWKNALGRIAYYRAVRSAIKLVTDGFKTGMDNLYQYSRLVGTEFAPSMDKLATSALYLKNSLGAIAAPLINSIAPVVDILIDKFVALLNVIGKVFAALTGKNVYSQAIKHATEYADAANDASKATKSFLLGIDELNVIEESASSGAGLAEDFGNMFEEVEVGEEFDWARQIREAIENGEWREAGTILAEKLNEIVESWDAYSWGEKLGEKINNGLNFAYGFMSNFGFRELGQKFGDLVLGLIDGIGLDGFDTLGRVLASKWNALFDIIAGILDEWEPRVADMGASIAAAINGWFDEIHWDEIADTISRGIVFIANLATETFKRIEWGKIGESFAEFLNNIKWYDIITSVADAIIEGFNGLKKMIDSFLGKWDWKESAKQIYTAINDSIKKIDPSGWGESLGNLFITAFKFLQEVIANIEWNDIGKKIAEFISGINWKELIDSFLKLLKTIVDSAITTFKSFLANIPDDVGAELLKIITLIGSAVIVAMTKNKAVLIAEGFLIFTAIFNEFGDQIKKLAGELAENINKFISDIDWKGVGKYISDGLKNALEAAITFIETLDWAGIGKAIADLLSGIDWFGLLTDFGRLVGDTISAVIILAVKNLPEILKIGAEIVAGIVAGIATAIAGIGITIYNILVKPIVDAVKDFLGIHSPSTVFAEIGENIVAGLLQGISDTWDSIVSFFEGAFDFLGGIFSSGWEILKALTRGDFGEIFDIISGAWTQTEDDTREKWSRISSETNTTWNELRDKSKENFEGIHQNISEQWEATKEKTKVTWDETSINLKNTWSDLKSQSDEDFGNIRDTIHTRWTETSEQTKQSWDDIQRGLVEKYEAINVDAGSGFEKVRNTVKDKHSLINSDIENAWADAKEKTTRKISELNVSAGVQMDELVGKARRWGEEISENIAAGIEAKKKRVTDSINTLASEISSRIHFSEPDVGPLSDFHTYMPDMMEGLAKGIRDNQHLAIDAVNDLAGNLANAFTNMSNKELEFPVHENAYIQYAEKYADDSTRNDRISNTNADTNASLETALRNGNNDVVSALYAVAGEIVNAVQGLEDRPVQVNLGRQELVRQVERGQRERGANLMPGGVRG